MIEKMSVEGILKGPVQVQAYPLKAGKKQAYCQVRTFGFEGLAANLGNVESGFYPELKVRIEHFRGESWQLRGVLGAPKVVETTTEPDQKGKAASAAR